MQSTEDDDDDDTPVTPAPKPATQDSATPAPTPAPQAPAPAPAAEVTDPYAGLPAAVRDALAEIPTLRHQVSSNNGRVAALTSALDEARARLTQVSTAPPPAPAAPTPPARNERLEAIRGELPEVADAIDSVLEQLGTRAPAPPAAAPAPTPAPAAGQAPAAAPVDPEVDFLNREHPGWANKMDGTNFKLWLSRQPAAYQQEVQTTGRSGVVITALSRFDKFEADVAAASQVGNRRAGRMAAAATPQGGGSRPASRSSEPQTEEEGFDAEVKKSRR